MNSGCVIFLLVGKRNVGRSKPLPYKNQNDFLLNNSCVDYTLCTIVQKILNLRQICLYNAGIGFGRFQRMLDDFPVDVLHETIADFHNTPKRVENLKKAIAEDKMGRAEDVKEDIDFVLECAEFADVVTSGIARGDIPVRVTHNDTKINNILFDANTGEAVAVIDLDTVMQGSALYDFGDALRMGASTAAEDEIDLDIVKFDIEAFAAFAKGFLSETKDVLTKTEIQLLPFSVKLLTYECGIRFLTDVILLLLRILRKR